MARWKRGQAAQGVKQAVHYAFGGVCDATLTAKTADGARAAAGYADAVMTRYIVENGAVRDDLLTRSQLKQLHRLASASGANGTLILVLGYTGVRWGEASALRVKDIDLEKRRLHIVENAVFVRGEIIVGSPKTHKRRSVPFPAFLNEQLRQAVEGKAETDLAFPGRFGEHQITPTIRHNSWFDKALVAAKLLPMTIHDLRHTTASLAVSAGANVKAVQRMLGHASAAMTLDVYADLFNDDLDDVAQRLDEAASSALDHSSEPSRDSTQQDHQTRHG